MPKKQQEEVTMSPELIREIEEEVVAHNVEEKKKKAHYIDNERFLNELLMYFKNCKIADERKVEQPKIPDYIGECFMKIATNLSRKPNFINYSYRDEMIMDGVENCLMYFRNFNPEKGKNPFSYFTQIIYFAFLRRISKEKKQSYVKYKLTEQYGIETLVEGQEEYDDSFHNRHPHETLYDNMADYIHNYEEKVEEKKKKRRKAHDEQLPEGDME